MKEFVLYGNGGHARVVHDLIQKLGGKVMAIFDHENIYNPSIFSDAEMVICIGNNEIRKKIAIEVRHKFATLIHPNATLANNVKIDEGSVIFANAVLQTNVIIGKHVIVNASATIDHDVNIGNFASIYPNSYIGSGARITEGKTIEPNQVVMRNAII